MRHSKLFVSVIALGLFAAVPAFAGKSGGDDDVSKSAASRSRTHVKAAKHPVNKTDGTEEATAADNTAINKRDRDDGAAKKTADQQKNDKNDVELAAEIRRAVVSDKTLSTNAHNIKIIVEGGHATLKGPVGSSAEKASVEKKAAAVVGAGNLTNQVDVAP